MTSINYNASATTALRTLQATNSALEATQNRVSTGLKIGEAKDNAAYWSISTTLKSDNKALATVKDALSLGAATVDTAYQGLNKTLEVLDEIKTKLTAATQDGVDKVAVQAEITELQKQLQSIASSASFSGENWLSTDTSAASYSKDKTVVASFTRSVDGTVALGTIGFDVSNSTLIDASATGNGMLGYTTGANTALGGLKVDAGTAGVGGATPTAGSSTTDAFAGPVTLRSNDVITFDVAVDGGTAKTITIDQALVNSTLGVTDGKITTSANFLSVVQAALVAGGVPTTKLTAAVGGTANTIKFTSATTGTTSTVAVSNVSAANTSVLAIDITGKSGAEITKFVTYVNAASNKVTAAAANLGAISSRIELQQSFVDTLVDTIDKGVSNLIDADLSEESTRLQALQTKQQLGIQALSIANSSTQNVLALFQN